MKTIKKTMPDVCNSLMCSPPQGYCSQCNHSVFFGSAKVRGKLWKWEFNSKFGPLYLRADDEPMKRQPSGRHPVWSKFNIWLKAWRARVEGKTKFKPLKASR